MKKSLSLILATAMLCTVLCACGSSDNSVDSSSSAIDTFLDDSADSFNSIGAASTTKGSSSSGAAMSSAAASSQSAGRSISAAYNDYKYAMNTARALTVYDYTGTAAFTVHKRSDIKLFETKTTAHSNGKSYDVQSVSTSKNYSNELCGTDEAYYYGASGDRSYTYIKQTYESPDDNYEKKSDAAFSKAALSKWLDNVINISQSDITGFSETVSGNKTYFKFIIGNSAGTKLLKNNLDAIDTSSASSIEVVYFVVSLTTDSTGMATERGMTVNCNISDSTGSYSYTLQRSSKINSTSAESISVSQPNWVK